MNRAVAFVLAASLWAVVSQSQPPDQILVNGRVFTGLPSTPWAEALAIKGDRILAVGRSQDILRMAGPSTRHVDLGGRVVVPGFNDAHTHFPTVSDAEVVGIGRALEPTCSRVLEAVTQAVQNEPSGRTVIVRIGTTAFFDPQCTPAALDRLSPTRPVLLSTNTHNSHIMNRAAAQKYGAHDGDRPPLGGFFGKDMTSPTWDGVVHGYAAFGINKQIQQYSQEALDAALKRAAQQGVTSLQFMTDDPQKAVDLLSRAESPLRIRLIPMQRSIGTTRTLLPRAVVPAHLADRVTVSGLKWVLDGTPIERSAALRNPYTDDSGASGRLNFPPDEITAILAEARAQDQQVMLHVVGDRTVQAVLSALEAGGGKSAWGERRVRLEHGGGLTPDFFRRARDLGVVVVQNPTHLSTDATDDLGARRLGPERSKAFSPLRGLLMAHVPLVLASDGPPTPYLNLMLATTYSGNPAEALTREQAVIALTSTAAFAEFAEKDKGTLEAGKLADLAILSQSIFDVAPAALLTTHALLTMIGGKVVQASDPFEGISDRFNVR